MSRRPSPVRRSLHARAQRSDDCRRLCRPGLVCGLLAPVGCCQPANSDVIASRFSERMRRRHAGGHSVLSDLFDWGAACRPSTGHNEAFRFLMAQITARARAELRPLTSWRPPHGTEWLRSRRITRTGRMRGT